MVAVRRLLPERATCPSGATLALSAIRPIPRCGPRQGSGFVSRSPVAPNRRVAWCASSGTAFEHVGVGRDHSAPADSDVVSRLAAFCVSWIRRRVPVLRGGPRQRRTGADPGGCARSGAPVGPPHALQMCRVAATSRQDCAAMHSDAPLPPLQAVAEWNKHWLRRVGGCAAEAGAFLPAAFTELSVDA